MSKALNKTKSNDNTGAMLCHLLALSGMIGVPIGNILGPLIIWLIKKDESALVDENGKESLNFQLSIIIYSFICLVTVVGILLLPFLGLFSLIMVIIASIKVYNGEKFKYPLTLRLIK